MKVMMRIEQIVDKRAVHLAIVVPKKDVYTVSICALVFSTRLLMISSSKFRMACTPILFVNTVMVMTAESRDSLILPVEDGDEMT
jgi:hypothetical protein